jgi:hypothetical protein
MKRFRSVLLVLSLLAACAHPALQRRGRVLGQEPLRGLRADSQLLWPLEDREVWFSLGENHEKAGRFGLHQLRNCSSVRLPGHYSALTLGPAGKV